LLEGDTWREYKGNKNNLLTFINRPQYQKYVHVIGRRWPEEVLRQTLVKSVKVYPTRLIKEEHVLVKGRG
jgi:hypothetical protein